MRRARVLVLALVLGACMSERAPNVGSERSSASGAAEGRLRRIQPLAVAPEQFGMLTWILGRWRGSDGVSAPFYEQYVQRTATVIATYSYPDSTFGTPSDSGLIELRGDTLVTGSPMMRWVAVSIDSSSVAFAPWENTSNSFIWTRERTGGWSATMAWDSAGVMRERIYQMRATAWGQIKVSESLIASRSRTLTP